MEGCSGCEDSQILDVSLKSEKISCSSQVLDSIWVPNSPPSFHVSASMVNFESAQGDHISQRQFINQVENHDSDDLDGCSHQPSKKRRLTQNQVQFLEKSFEVENKLEPDRKNQLAKEVGLQPRQVAIWFQNRRARCKTKVLERDYGSLKASFDKLKADCETLSAENDKLKNEVQLLRKKLLLEENENPKPESCDPIILSPLDFQPKNEFISQDAPEAAYKQDDAASSAKSDVFDSDSPHYTSHAFEHDPSDFSQGEDESLLHFPKIEVECYDDLQPNSCNLGFPVQDQGTWFWQY
ncbi:hypothetical protein OROMI_010158 [Orobanche minor]